MEKPIGYEKGKQHLTDKMHLRLEAIYQMLKHSVQLIFETNEIHSVKHAQDLTLHMLLEI